MATVAGGPLLGSVRTAPHATGEARSQVEQIKRRLPGRNKIHGNSFNMQIGFYQAFSREQLESIFVQAGVGVARQGGGVYPAAWDSKSQAT